MKTIPFRERPACTIAEACEVVGVCRSTLYALMGEGRLETVNLGRRRLVLVPSLLRILEASQDASQPPKAA